MSKLKYNMDKISFTGIKNIKIKRKSYEQFGHYLPSAYKSMTGELEDVLVYGKKKYNEMHIECDLINDADGNHFSRFLEYLKSSKLKYEFNCIDHKNPHHVDLYIKRFDAKDDIGHTSNSEFKINGYPIILSDDEVLPLYSFMAKLTREIKNMPELSEMRRKCASFFNKSVHKEAVEFIEM